MWLARVVPALAQQPIVEIDSSSAELHTALRAFYFNLARRDWEALAAEILSAKVMASHPAPASLLGLAGQPSHADNTQDCSATAAWRVDHASITLVGDWAEVLVPLCPRTGAVDELRLVHFERRWRIIYIDLWQAPDAVQLAR